MHRTHDRAPSCVRTASNEIWYPLCCNGVYQPFQYACDDYLRKEWIRPSEASCIRLCDELNGRRMR